MGAQSRDLANPDLGDHGSLPAGSDVEAESRGMSRNSLGHRDERQDKREENFRHGTGCTLSGAYLTTKVNMKFFHLNYKNIF